MVNPGYWNYDEWVPITGDPDPTVRGQEMLAEMAAASMEVTLDAHRAIGYVPLLRPDHDRECHDIAQVHRAGSVGYIDRASPKQVCDICPPEYIAWLRTQ